MGHLFRIGLILLMVMLPSWSQAGHFRFEKIRPNVHAAIAQPGSKAASNSLIIMTSYQVILAGAHFVPETISELLEYIRTVTPIPVRYIILTHHHKGFNYIDFDLPANAEIIASGPTWQALKGEFRQIRNQVTFFDRSMSMKRGSTVIVLNATEQGHSEGDLFVYLPEEGVLFTSDLFFNEVAGYMGDGHFRHWITTLELLAAIDAKTVVPGLGPVTTSDGIRQFQVFFREFTTEVLRLAGKGLSLEAARRQFSLPAYEALPGYRAFFDVNFNRAFQELKELK